MRRNGKVGYIILGKSSFLLLFLSIGFACPYLLDVQQVPNPVRAGNDVNLSLVFSETPDAVIIKDELSGSKTYTPQNEYLKAQINIPEGLGDTGLEIIIKLEKSGCTAQEYQKIINTTTVENVLPIDGLNPVIIALIVAGVAIMEKRKS